MEKGVTITKICSYVLRNNDTTPPVTTATLDPPVPNGMNGWYVSPITVTLTSTDDLSGVNATFYRINNTNWERYITPFIIDHDGMYTVEFYSTDRAGNSETIKSVNIRLDQTPPYFVIISKRRGLSGWDIIVDIIDNMSGVAYVEFYFGSVLQITISAPGPYEWTLQPIPNVNGTITVVAYDVAGNHASHGTHTSCGAQQSTMQSYNQHNSHYISLRNSALRILEERQR